MTDPTEEAVTLANIPIPSNTENDRFRNKNEQPSEDEAVNGDISKQKTNDEIEAISLSSCFSSSSRPIGSDDVCNTRNRDQFTKEQKQQEISFMIPSNVGNVGRSEQQEQTKILSSVSIQQAQSSLGRISIFANTENEAPDSHEEENANSTRHVMDTPSVDPRASSNSLPSCDPKSSSKLFETQVSKNDDTKTILDQKDVERNHSDNTRWLMLAASEPSSPVTTKDTRKRTSQHSQQEKYDQTASVNQMRQVMNSRTQSADQQSRTESDQVPRSVAWMTSKLQKVEDGPNLPPAWIYKQQRHNTRPVEPGAVSTHRTTQNKDDDKTSTNHKTGPNKSYFDSSKHEVFKTSFLQQKMIKQEQNDSSISALSTAAANCPGHNQANAFVNQNDEKRAQQTTTLKGHLNTADDDSWVNNKANATKGTSEMGTWEPEREVVAALSLLNDDNENTSSRNKVKSMNAVHHRHHHHDHNHAHRRKHPPKVKPPIQQDSAADQFAKRRRAATNNRATQPGVVASPATTNEDPNYNPRRTDQRITTTDRQHCTNSSNHPNDDSKALESILANQSTKQVVSNHNALLKDNFDGNGRKRNERFALAVGQNAVDQFAKQRFGSNTGTKQAGAVGSVAGNSSNLNRNDETDKTIDAHEVSSLSAENAKIRQNMTPCPVSRTSFTLQNEPAASTGSNNDGCGNSNHNHFVKNDQCSAVSTGQRAKQQNGLNLGNLGLGLVASIDSSSMTGTITKQQGMRSSSFNMNRQDDPINNNWKQSNEGNCKDATRDNMNRQDDPKVCRMPNNSTGAAIEKTNKVNATIPHDDGDKLFSKQCRNGNVGASISVVGPYWSDNDTIQPKVSNSHEIGVLIIGVGSASSTSSRCNDSVARSIAPKSTLHNRTAAITSRHTNHNDDEQREQSILKAKEKDIREESDFSICDHSSKFASGENSNTSLSWLEEGSSSTSSGYFGESHDCVYDISKLYETNEKADGLAIAVEVKSDNEKDLVEAENYCKTRKYRRPLSVDLLACFAFAFVSCLVAAFVVTFERSPENPNTMEAITIEPTAAPSAIPFHSIAPTTSDEMRLRGWLAEQNISQVILDSYPVAFDMAIHWYANLDMSRNSSIPGVTEDWNFERFILIWFYYISSSNGTIPWVSCNPPVYASHQADECVFFKWNGTASDRSHVNFTRHADSPRWLSKYNHCDWPGVSCVTSVSEEGPRNDSVQCEGAVNGIELIAFGLSGSLPAVVSQFECMASLVIAYNPDLTGTISPELFQFRNQASLRTFRLVNNKRMSGSIPDGLWDLSNLENIQIGDNGLTGTLPDFDRRLPYLKTLWLFGNSFGGRPLPIVDGKPFLTSLRFQRDIIGFTGSIPHEYGYLTALKELWLFQNRLTGSIPANFEDLPLEDLWLYNNNLNGTIPPNFTNLSQMRSFRVSNNRLTGKLPDMFWENLKHFDVHTNRLKGKLPRRLFEMTKLEYFAVDRNYLSGTIDPRIGENVPGITTFSIRENNFRGTIPSSLSKLVNLKELFLDTNNFQGSLPLEICRLRNVDRLSILTADCLAYPPQNDCFCCTGCCDKALRSCEVVNWVAKNGTSFEDDPVLFRSFYDVWG